MEEDGQRSISASQDRPSRFKKHERGKHQGNTSCGYITTLLESETVW